MVCEQQARGILLEGQPKDIHTNEMQQKLGQTYEEQRKDEKTKDIQHKDGKDHKDGKAKKVPSKDVHTRESLYIEGGKKLSGYIEVDGSKNAVLPILAATVLVPGLSVIENVPNLKDVTMTLEILSSIGCKVNRVGSTVFVDSSEINCYQIPNMLAGEIRSSITFLGALLGRCGEVSICYPGGCVKNLTHLHRGANKIAAFHEFATPATLAAEGKGKG